MSTRKAVAAVCSVLLGALVAALPARADSDIRIVRLSLVDGPVQIDRMTGTGYERAITNMPITRGMQLWTQGDSRAEVEFENGATIRLTPSAHLEFSELSLRSDGTRVSTVRLADGRAYLNFGSSKQDDFRLVVGNQAIELNRPAHIRVDVTQGRAEIAVFKGEVDLRGATQSARVKKNETLTLDLNDGARYELAKGIAPEMEDRWDSYRSDYHDKYARSGYNGAPYYGRSDLNYYGQWVNTGYGRAWRPFGAGAAWDPWASGAWAWYPGYGYTFVSSYAWGWLPYRSGQWLWAPGFGWCWRPGGFNPWGSINVANAPSGFAPVQPPTTGGGTVIPPTVIVGTGRDSDYPRVKGRYVDPDAPDGSSSGGRGGAYVPGATYSSAPGPRDPAQPRTMDRPQRGEAPNRSMEPAPPRPQPSRNMEYERGPRLPRNVDTPRPRDPEMSRPSRPAMSAPPPSPAPQRMSAPPPPPAPAPAPQAAPSRPSRVKE